MSNQRAIQVARYLIRLAAAEDEHEWLNPLRLQKLLYYVQGWSLALRRKPMFSDPIEAWVHGPVVPAVWRTFSGFDPINPEAVSPSGLAADDSEFVAAVWQGYRSHSASSLRDMTHREEPWVKARGERGPAERCNEEITHESMRKFFSKASRKK